MKLDLKGIRVVKCEYRNEMGPNTKLNLQVNVNNQIKLPKEFERRFCWYSHYEVIRVRFYLFHPLYMYLEQISTFRTVNPVRGKSRTTKA